MLDVEKLGRKVAGRLRDLRLVDDTEDAMVILADELADFALTIVRACARVAEPDLHPDTLWTQRVWGRHDAATAIRYAARKGRGKRGK